MVADGNGLYIRLRNARVDVSRTWLFRRRAARRMVVVTLGTYPTRSVRDARSKAAERSSRRGLRSPTVQEAASQWLTERVNRTLRKADQIEGYVNRAVIPTLGTRRVTLRFGGPTTKFSESWNDEAWRGEAT